MRSTRRFTRTRLAMPQLLLVGLKIGCFFVASLSILQNLDLSARIRSTNNAIGWLPTVVATKGTTQHHRRLSSTSSLARNRKAQQQIVKAKNKKHNNKGATVPPIVNKEPPLDPRQNEAFLKDMQQLHSPMFQLANYTVLGPTSFPKPSAMAENIPLLDDQTKLSQLISTASPIVPYLTPTFGTHRATADAVFLFAAEYPLSSYILFISSLRQTGFDGDIVIAISVLDWKDPAVRIYLSHDPHVIIYAIQFSCFNAEWELVTSVKGGMRVCQCHQLYGRQQLEGDKVIVPLPDPREPRTIPTTRYELYWIWVQYYHPNVWMLLIDARDTWFQTNPFNDLPRQVAESPETTIKSGQLYLFGENIEATRIGRSEKNRKWLEHAYGAVVVEALQDKPTICSGSTMGERIAIETYLRAMVAESDDTGTKLMGADQGFHNFLYYSGKLQTATSISKIVVFDQGRGRINNLGAMRIKPLEEWGNGNLVRQLPDDSIQVYNWDGSLSPVVHQFDRHKALSVYIYETLTEYYQQQWADQQQLLRNGVAATS